VISEWRKTGPKIPAGPHHAVRAAEINLFPLPTLLFIAGIETLDQPVSHLEDWVTTLPARRLPRRSLAQGRTTGQVKMHPARSRHDRPRKSWGSADTVLSGAAKSAIKECGPRAGESKSIWRNWTIKSPRR
jgi:hypothetical protein